MNLSAVHTAHTHIKIRVTYLLPDINLTVHEDILSCVEEDHLLLTGDEGVQPGELTSLDHEALGKEG